MNKIEKLIDIINGYGNIAIAFSGGIDSCFLLFAAKKYSENTVIALTANGSMVPKRELDFAKKFAAKISAKHIVFEAEEFKINEFCSNIPDRCYYCKKSIMTKAVNIAAENSIFTVLDGSNLDDINDFRPGRRALMELNIKSPLIKAGFTKRDIKYYSKKLLIEGYTRQSSACLASRIPYYREIAKKDLKRIEKAENFIFDLGFTCFRVRHYDDLAKIEVSKNEIKKLFLQRDEIKKGLKNIGYKYISLDLDPFESGSMNKSIKEKTI